MKQANASDIFLEIRIRNRICNLDELFAKRSRDGLTMPFFGAVPNGIFLFRRLLNKRRWQFETKIVRETNLHRWLYKVNLLYGLLDLKYCLKLRFVLNLGFDNEECNFITFVC